MNLHFFDVDYTILRRSTVIEFLFFGLKEGLVGCSIFWYLPGLFFNYLIHGSKGAHAEKSYPFFKGIEKSKLEALSQQVFENRLLPYLDQEIVQRIKVLQNEGKQIVLASSSFLILLEPLARYLGIQDIISSEIEFNEGLSTGRLAGEAPFGTGKKNRIMEYLSERKIAAKDCAFYSDSSQDLPLLRAVGNPVVVNPKRKLRHIAQKKGWEIIDTK